MSPLGFLEVGDKETGPASWCGAGPNDVGKGIRISSILKEFFNLSLLWKAFPYLLRGMLLTLKPAFLSEVLVVIFGLFMAVLRNLLDRAGVEGEASNVVFSSAGGYTTSLTLDDVEKTAPLLADEVNGGRLPDDQGFPVRLVVPRRLGYKWIKWVTGIKLVSGGYDGFWESRGYSNDADASGRLMAQAQATFRIMPTPEKFRESFKGMLG